MMDPGPIWKQTQQFGDNGAIVHRLIVWRSNDAVANVRSPPYLNLLPTELSAPPLN
jgi:hypothetical protein|eukprot:COSAG06_NODE_6299_length_2993_cov_5.544072_4_plen_56_part_00